MRWDPLDVMLGAIIGLALGMLLMAGVIAVLEADCPSKNYTEITH